MDRASLLLQQLTARTFEELYFLPAEPAEPTAAEPAAGAIGVHFHGPVHGTLTVRMDDALAALLVTNLLGADAPVEPAMARDTVGELANVLCGHALPELFGANEVFQIEAPASLPAPGPGEVLGHAALLVEGGRVDVTLTRAA